MANLQIIKELAREKNFPLEQLAKELEITPQALSKIMRENSTKVSTLERIAQILKVSVMVFFPEEQNAPYSISQKVKGRENLFSATGNVSGGVPADIHRQVLDEISAQRRLVEKRDEQIDRLLSMLENLKPCPA